MRRNHLAGRLYFMIRTEDLAARRFEKTWMTCSATERQGKGDG
ncbi:MAG TPA: hypothetical protein DEP45_09480 [Armatimonadetes bacterium]|nr:hypothetical protein [Armatimonadota bacterium]